MQIESRHVSRSGARPAVLIAQRRLTHYRVPLFEQLRDALDSAGVALHVVHGDAMPQEQSKRDGASLPWAEHAPCRYAFDGRLCWQDLREPLRGVDLAIVTQENRLLFNYLLPLRRAVPRWAFWGHGRNFQADDERSLSERFKQWFMQRPDWWFTYTPRSANVLLESGYPPARITVLNNSIDTAELREQLPALSVEGEGAAMGALGIRPGPVALVLGSLYADKRIDFVLEAAHRVHEQLPGFQLLFVGDGPLRQLVIDAADASGGWIRWLGARTGADKAALLRRADLLLNPGAVGLVVLDSFASGTPLLTCELARHGPEVSYLEHGVNGWITPNDIDAYVRAACWLLRHAALRERLRAACLRDADRYSLQAMVERYRDGILACLAAPPRTRLESHRTRRTAH